MALSLDKEVAGVLHHDVGVYTAWIIAGDEVVDSELAELVARRCHDHGGNGSQLQEESAELRLLGTPRRDVCGKSSHVLPVLCCGGYVDVEAHHRGLSGAQMHVIPAEVDPGSHVLPALGGQAVGYAPVDGALGVHRAQQDGCGRRSAVADEDVQVQRSSGPAGLSEVAQPGKLISVGIRGQELDWWGGWLASGSGHPRVAAKLAVKTAISVSVRTARLRPVISLSFVNRFMRCVVYGPETIETVSVEL
jgi:hypothetical protein